MQLSVKQRRKESLKNFRRWMRITENLWECLGKENARTCKVEVRALEQELAEVNSSLEDIQELRMQESAEAKRKIQELEAKVQAWVELGILKDVFSKPPPHLLRD